MGMGMFLHTNLTGRSIQRLTYRKVHSLGMEKVWSGAPQFDGFLGDILSLSSYKTDEEGDDCGCDWDSDSDHTVGRPDYRPRAPCGTHRKPDVRDTAVCL